MIEMKKETFFVALGSFATLALGMALRNRRPDWYEVSIPSEGSSKVRTVLGIVKDGGEAKRWAARWRKAGKDAIVTPCYDDDVPPSTGRRHSPPRFGKS